MANENRNIVEEYLTAWAKGDTKTLERVVDDRLKANNPPPFSPDKQGLIEASRAFITGFPDQRVRFERWVVEGDNVAVRFIGTGTHKGEFMGIKPSGNKVEVTGLALVTVRNGKIVEDATEFDALGLFQQIGEMPDLEEMAHH
jgi:predicted ester cyclase